MGQPGLARLGFGTIISIKWEGWQRVSPDAEKVTGHRPRDYRQFATDHRQAFAG
jgi:hypothetical protein